jgi:hypothetical protein
MLGRVSKLAAVWALSLELHKVPISVSPHCTQKRKFDNEIDRKQELVLPT